MEITLTLNGKKLTRMVEADTVLLDFLRKEGCYSVKRGCDTTNCGLCTVFMDDKPVLSCAILAARAADHSIVTMEGMQQEAAEFGAFIADQGAEQCGFCNPGMIMNAIALLRENSEPTEAEIKEFLAGNLCRCSGYEGQLRGIQNFIAWKKAQAQA
ncbi:2Fe-2S iron-sulfur cluster-binding protein [uncultured Phascolarctobacterium sp.]|uniref:(2Fe-2S)-binding protein n=1 Tax=uncultured Phascolarctobacterium sp. TaxID=512296 RepID=UPI0025F08D03|nr:2Fe-2S iron-sulfur cluster-binding protein [uncultured Phascolarctobacterium sp.]